MEYIVGITLALFFCGAAAGLGMDRERVFYPAVAIAVTSYYLAFAVADGRSEVCWPRWRSRPSSSPRRCWGSSAARGSPCSHWAGTA